MHAVMPKMLRKVTEPKKSYAKDYAIDVDQRIAEVLEKWEKEKKRKSPSGLALNETAR